MTRENYMKFKFQFFCKHATHSCSCVVCGCFRATVAVAETAQPTSLQWRPSGLCRKGLPIPVREGYQGYQAWGQEAWG